MGREKDNYPHIAETFDGGEKKIITLMWQRHLVEEKKIIILMWQRHLVGEKKIITLM